MARAGEDSNALPSSLTRLMSSAFTVTMTVLALINSAAQRTRSVQGGGNSMRSQQQLELKRGLCTMGGFECVSIRHSNIGFHKHKLPLEHS